MSVVVQAQTVMAEEATIASSLLVREAIATHVLSPLADGHQRIFFFFHQIHTAQRFFQ